MNTEELQQRLLTSFEIDEQLLPATHSNEERFQAFRNLLIRRIEELADKDMDKLVWILYRIDVSEKKLNETLKQTAPEDFATTITDMIIERQVQKIATRKQFGEKEGEWDFDV